MTQPLNEWLASFKARQADFARRHTGDLAFISDEFAADLTRAVEELEKPVAITDEMVERAAKVLFEDEGGAAWEHAYADEAAECRQKARLVIEAALGKHPRDAQEGTK